MALVSLANLVGIQTGPALDGDARPWRSETLSINRNKVAPAQFDPAGARPEPREGSDMVKCIRATRAERQWALRRKTVSDTGDSEARSGRPARALA